ncbi:MAG: site-2 protease family protein [Planctomycetaceae bacterium]|nr:site-2 protease family protein [Planctomycetaceae bacterium]
MDIRQNPLLLGFSLGRWWGTNVRVSLFFPLLGVILCAQLGLRLGLAATAVLLVSILFHEFCHILAARRTGGFGDEIMIWPLGGLAWVKPAPTFVSQFWTPAVGPLSNILLCLCALPAVLINGAPVGTFSMIYVPDLSFTSESFLRDTMTLFCSLNFKLAILNLLPIYPLDGSQMVTVVASQYRPREVARLGTLWFGLFLCIIITAVGATWDLSPVVFFGFLLMTLCMHEFYMLQFRQALGGWSSEQRTESFMGYDFSQGYAAFEDDDDDLTPHQRRQQERAEQQRLKEQREREQIRQQVDELLDKVHQQGMDSLTDAERKFLQQASKKYPSRGEA